MARNFVRRGTGQGTIQSGRKARVLIKEETSFQADLPIPEADLYKYIPKIGSISFTDNSGRINAGYLSSTRAASRGQLGPAEFGGSASWSITRGGDTAILWRQLLNAGVGTSSGRPAQSTAKTQKTHIDGGDVSTAVTTAVSFTTDIVANEPAQLVVTLDSAAAGTVTINGYDWAGTAQSDTLVFAASDTTKTTTNFYAAPPGMNTTTYTATAFGAGRTIDITSTSPLIQVEFTIPTTGRAFTYGTSMEILVDEISAAVANAVIQDASISLARDSALTCDANYVALDLLPRTNFEGEENDGGMAISGTVVDASDIVHTGWQSRLVVDGNTEPLLDLTLNINQNVESIPLIIKSRLAGDPLPGTREITLTGSRALTKELNLEDYFISDRDFENVKLELCSAPKGGFPYQIEFDFARMNLVEYPGYSAGDETAAPQNFNLQAFPSSTTAADDIKITLTCKDDEFNDDYLAAIDSTG